MSLPERNWEFTELSEKMGITTSAFFKVLPSSGLSDEEILVREAIQNSRDAGNGDAKVLVTFSAKSLDQEKAKKLSEALLLDEVIKERGDHLNDTARKSFEAELKGEQPLRLLEIADYGTCGLGGNWKGRSEADHFARLVIRIGESEKSDDESSKGGSFGFGKTVFAKRSSVNLVVYYSVPHENHRPEGHKARFMAVWLLKNHEIDGKECSGYCFLGRRHGPGDSVAPLIDEDAHAMAAACGLTVRSDENPGSSVAILSCGLDIERIKDAVEVYWWPALIDQNLAVRISNDGKDLGVTPKKNPKVAPYVALMKALRESDVGREWKSSSTDPEIKVRNFRAFLGYPFGSIAMKALTEEQVSAWKDAMQEEQENPDDGVLIGGIALVRGTGMVVTYHSPSDSSGTIFTGLFEAHKDIDPILRISEPPAHHEWDDQESRLKSMFPEVGQKLVRSLNKRLAESLIQFRRNQPPPPPPSEYRLNQLESLLSKFVNSGNTSEPVPPGPERPISIRVKSSREISESGQIDTAQILISIREDLEIDTLACRCRVDYNLLGDTSSHVIERKKCAVFDEAGNQVASEDQSEFNLVLHKSAPCQLRATATALENSKAEFKVSVAKQTDT